MELHAHRIDLFIHSKYFDISDWLIFHKQMALTTFGEFEQQYTIDSLV